MGKTKIRVRSGLIFFVACLWLLKACQFSGTSSMPFFASSSPVKSRPNVLIIVSDDQRYDTMEYMPRTIARIFKQGVSFPNAYVTTPLCCPSRASILTGMYAHTHGVRINSDHLLKETFVERLKKSGYYTGLVGKYLNSWDGSARPEFDSWVAFRGGAHRYIDPRLNVNGTWSEHKGHITHIFRDYALEFLNRASQQEKPFVLLFTPNAPHFSTSGPSRPPARDLHPPDPAPGDEKLYESLTLHRPPNFNKPDLFDKPRWFQSRALLTPELIAMIDSFRRKQLQSLNALDLAIDSLLTALAAQGKLDDTLVFYLSDNGLFWGEYRSPGGKGAVYQEASRVPFAVRYPRLVKEPRVDTALLANIDVAPTIYELAGIPTPPEVDGRSLVPLLRGKNTPVRWREELLIEGWPAPERVEQGRAPYAAIHTGRYVYVETEGDKPELYDLTTDPYQIQNRVDNPAYAAVVTDLKARLRHMQAAPPAVLQR